jgi:RNA polymerase sigma factor (sigma-70 family)
VQGAFLAYCRTLSSGEEIMNEKAWLLCVTRREAHRIFERDSRECGLPGDGIGFDDIEAPASEPEPAFARDSVLPLLSLLTPREEAALHLRLSSMKYKDIAAELGVTIPTVNTLLARAVEKLRRALKPVESASGETAARKEGHAARRVQ